MIRSSRHRSRRGTIAALGALLACGVLVGAGAGAGPASGVVRPSPDDPVPAPASPLSAASAETENPVLPDECGLRIVLVVDRSGSTREFDADYRAAASSFVADLSGTPNHIGVVTFADDAQVASPYVDVADASAADALALDLTATPGTLGGIGVFTNWQAALRVVSDDFDDADLVVFVTDGNPTVHDGEGLDHLTSAVSAAHAIRSTGTHVTGVAVGNLGESGLDNIAAVTGIGNVIDPARAVDASHDVYETADPSGLTAVLTNLTTQLCGGTVTIHKSFASADHAPSSDGWVFSAEGKVSGTTGSNGPGLTNLRFDQPGTKTITESGGTQGYTLASVVCDHATVVPTGASFTIAVGGNDIVHCEVVNRAHPDLAIDKKVVAGPTPTEGGDEQRIDYTLTVDNLGPGDAQGGAATVSDVLPADAHRVAVTPPSASVPCQIASLLITCSVPYDQLDVADAPVVIRVTITVPTGSATAVNQSLVVSRDDDPGCTVSGSRIACVHDPGNNFSQTSTEVPGVPPPAPTTSGDAPPATVAADVATAPEGAPIPVRSLAFTGSGSGRWAWYGGILVAVGVLLLALARRSRRNAAR
jgi:uncharacterized repeat protein (TIGR01451 family)